VVSKQDVSDCRFDMVREIYLNGNLLGSFYYCHRRARCLFPDSRHSF